MHMSRWSHLCSRNIYTFVSLLDKSVTLEQKLTIPLQQWILNYFQNTDDFIRYNRQLPSNENTYKLLKSKETEDAKLPLNIKLLDYTINLDDVIHKRISHYKCWDNELYSRIQKHPQLLDILKVMDFWITFLPNKCINLRSYRFAVEFISNVVKYEEISRQSLIQCMHYVSFLKNQNETQNIMNTVINKLHKQPIVLKEFTLEEMCIFCNSLFTTSTKINSTVIIKSIVKVLSENLDRILLPENQQMLSCLIKPLRLSRYYDYCVLDNIAEKLTTIKLNNSQSVANLLPLYSDALYSDLTKIELFGNNFFLCFENESKVLDVRIKDIDRFLWAFSNLGCEGCKHEIKEVIVPFLLSRIIYVMEWPAYFVNSLLWLHMLQCSSEELTKSVLKTQTLQRILKTGHIRNAARYSLLLSCLNIENKELLSQEMMDLQQNTLEPTMEKHLSIRPQLANVYKAVLCLQATLGIKHVAIGYQVPCLYIAGITVQTNRTIIEIEVLENSLCLHNSDIPHGLMKLKLRLMKAMGRKMILIDKSTTELDTETLFMHIEDTIKKESYM